MHNFNYHAPNTIEDCIKIFNSADFPKYLAGGMTLIPSLKQKLSAPTDIIDLQNIKILKGIYLNDNKQVTIGALNTHNEIAKNKIIQENIKGLSYLASNIADNAIRNLGTIGGSICNSDPAADYPAALLSLNATIMTNKRNINAKDFFIDMFETALADDEIVLSISIPMSTNSYYMKFASQASKYAIVGLFGSCKDNIVKLSITGASNKVFCINELDNLTPEQIQKINLNELNLNRYSINNDIHASSEYREALIKSMVKNIIKYLSVYK